MSEESKQLPDDKAPVNDYKQEVAPELVLGAAAELVPEVAPELVSEEAPASLTEIHKNEPPGTPIKWNQNKKIPRIYPGIILSIILTVLLPVTFFHFTTVIGNSVGFVVLLVTVYWTFCVFRLTGQLQYKSKTLKITDRILALLIPLLSNPGVLVLFLGMVLAACAIFVSETFHFTQDYAHQHSGPAVHYAWIGLLLLSIVMVAIPIIAIPTICMGWTYKFMVKVASVNEPVEKSTFRKTRGPAIFVLVNNFIFVEILQYGLLSIGAPDNSCALFALTGFLHADYARRSISLFSGAASERRKLLSNKNGL